MAALNKGHVYFGSDDCIPRENSILIKQTSPGCVEVHLGFLQYNYTYSMTIEIPKCYFMGNDIEALLSAAEKSIPNINCKVVSIKDKDDFFEFIVEFHAQKERLVKEQLKFLLKEDEKMTIELVARVLGPGKGTPLLKNGIRCINVAHDDLSEASDWHG